MPDEQVHGADHFVNLANLSTLICPLSTLDLRQLLGKLVVWPARPSHHWRMKQQARRLRPKLGGEPQLFSRLPNVSRSSPLR